MVKQDKKTGNEKDVEQQPIYNATKIEKTLCFFGGIAIVWLVAYAIGMFLPFSPIISTALAWLISIFTAGSIIFSFIWLPRSIVWTKLEENQAKFIMFLGAFRKLLVLYSDHKVKDGKEVVEEPGALDKSLFGGIRFVGIWPFWSIHAWEFFNWYGVDESGKPVFHGREWTDHVNLKNYEYKLFIEDIADVENVPLDFDASIFSRVAIPKTAIINNANFLNQTLQTLQSEIKHIVRQKPYNEVDKELKSELCKKNNGGGEEKKKDSAKDEEKKETEEECDLKKLTNKEILGGAQEVGTLFWLKLKKDGTLDEIKEKFGVDVFGIKIRRFAPTKEYLETTTLPYKAEQEGKAVVIRAKYEAQRDSEEVIGTFMHMLARRIGLTDEELKDQMANDTTFNEKYSSQIKECNDILKQKLSLDGRALIHIIGPQGQNIGVSPSTESIAAIAALLRTLNMPAVSGTGSGSGQPQISSGEQSTITPSAQKKTSSKKGEGENKDNSGDDENAILSIEDIIDGKRLNY
ncbi:MAG: hypothetical protein PHG23_02300 [Candidatus Pacebacteria bacterium]|nr:hypothetical protein [Candidatus Paceibacterota bacterium]